MRGEDHGRPRLPEVEHRVLDDLGIDRVEAGERLVQDQQLGPVEHRRDELDLLGHPLGEGLDLLSIQAASPMRSSHAAIERSSSGCRAPFSAAVVAEQPPHGHPLVEPALLGQVADPVVRGPRARSPRTSISPASGSRMCMIIRNVVVLPDPLGPMNP